MQQLRDGLDNFFVTFIEVLRERAPGRGVVEVEPGVTSGDFLSGFLQGTRKALTESGRESITITLDETGPATVGKLIALYERTVGFYASLEFLAQVRSTFLVCSGSDGLYILDQHAAADPVPHREAREEALLLGELVELAARAGDADRVLPERETDPLVGGLGLEHAVARLLGAARLRDHDGERFVEAGADLIEHPIDAVRVGVVEEERLHPIGG